MGLRHVIECITNINFWSTQMSFRPLYDNILIKRVAAEDKTKSGLFLPKSDQEKPQQGKVIATGPGKLNKAGHFSGTTVQTGNLVLFGKYHSGENIDINGEEHIIIKESELLAIVQ